MAITELDSQNPPETQRMRAVDEVPPDQPNASPLPKARSVDPAVYLELRIWAEMFDDAQEARISCENRIRSGGVPSEIYADQLAAMRTAEHSIGLAMRRCFRRLCPELAAWQKQTTGIGEHLLARLVGIIGHPVMASPHHWEGAGASRVLVEDPPFLRSVSQLWSYCGHGDPRRRRRAGMTADEAMKLGNPRAKDVVHLLAEATMKCVGTLKEVAYPIDRSAAVTSFPSESIAFPNPTVGAVPREDFGPTIWPSTPILSAPGREAVGDDDATMPAHPMIPTRRRSPYRDTYEQARITYTTRTHSTPCVRCGPSGKPALEGSPWPAAHQHAAALRLVGKHILRDLWLVSRGSLTD